MLVGQFGDDSAYVASVRGGHEFRPWTSQMHMLATLVNLTYAGNRQRGGKPTRKPLVEPPKKSRKPKRLTVSELIKMQQGPPRD